jgi:hypothetical protein
MAAAGGELENPAVASCRHPASSAFLFASRYRAIFADAASATRYLRLDGCAKGGAHRILRYGGRYLNIAALLDKRAGAGAHPRVVPPALSAALERIIIQMGGSYRPIM